MVTWGLPELQADYAEVCNGFSSAQMLHFSSGLRKELCIICHYTGEHNIHAQKNTTVGILDSVVTA